MNRKYNGDTTRKVSGKKLPLVSVIIPSMQADTELRRCIDSVNIAVGDNYDVEIIVVTPPSLLNETQSLLPFVDVIAESRAGIYAAMNDGVRYSSGRYLYFIGKDDILLPSFCLALNVLQTESPDVIFCNVYWGDMGIHFGDPSRYLILRRNICHQGIIYSKQAFNKHGPYLRRMKVWADYLLNIKIIWDDEMKIRYLNIPLALYSLNGFSSNNKDMLFERLRPLIYRRYVGFFGCLMLRFFRRLGKM